jgi:signal transduction histidine kinase
MTVEPLPKGLVLVLDQDEARRSAVRESLLHAGMEVHEAVSPEAAIAATVNIEPGAILIQGPFEKDFYRELRSLPLQFPPALVRVGNGEREDDSMDAGGHSAALDAWLPDLCSPNLLVSTLRTVLLLRETRKELASANRRLAEARQEVQHGEDELELFALRMSHDLAGSFRAMTMFSRLSQENPVKRSQDEIHYLGSALCGLGAEYRMAASLASYSQIAKDLRSPLGPVDLNLTVEAARRAVAKESNAALEVEISSPLPAVRGNADRLEQLFQCLLRNAVSYCKPENPPWVSIGNRREPPSRAVIAVSDHGPGIAKQYHQSVFQPFKRLHAAPPGSGMGLAICKKIAEAHGGRIWVESEPGEGATFLISLILAS